MDLPNKDLEHPEKSKKQAEAEVVPSSSLVEVGRYSLDKLSQVGGWVAGAIGNKTIPAASK